MIVAGLFPVIAVVLFAVGGPQTRFRWAGVLCGTVAIMFLIYFASRQIEQRNLKNYIERCRLASQNISWKTS